MGYPTVEVYPESSGESQENTKDMKGDTGYCHLLGQGLNTFAPGHKGLIQAVPWCPNLSPPGHAGTHENAHWVASPDRRQQGAAFGEEVPGPGASKKLLDAALSLL